MIIGVDNHNDYYDPKLKEDRLNKFIENENYVPSAVIFQIKILLTIFLRHTVLKKL